jgi:hypothetical protein
MAALDDVKDPVTRLVRSTLAESLMHMEWIDHHPEHVTDELAASRARVGALAVEFAEASMEASGQNPDAIPGQEKRRLAARFLWFMRAVRQLREEIEETVAALPAEERGEPFRFTVTVEMMRGVSERWASEFATKPPATEYHRVLQRRCHRSLVALERLARDRAPVGRRAPGGRARRRERRSGVQRRRTQARSDPDPLLPARREAGQFRAPHGPGGDLRRTIATRAGDAA